MQQRHQIYQCTVCNNVVEILRPGNDQQEVCHKPTIISPKTDDVGKEKHVPVVEKTENGIHVSVGSVPHPMEETHFIEWIEIIEGNKTYRVYLKAGDKPEADFPKINGPFIVRELCNIHGLWETTVT